MPEQASVTVLVVEDNPVEATLLRMSLNRRGFNVVSAKTLAQALEILQTGDIQVVLLDLSLPDSEGIQTFYDIHAAVNAIPIVVLTSLNDQNIAAEALKRGAQDYLVKGVPTDESVARCLTYAIQRQQFETELWQSERRTRLILENAQDAFFAVDASGVIISWNKQAETMFGYMRKDALGEPLVGLIFSPSERKKFNQGVRAFLNGEDSSIVNERTELTMRHKDHHEFPAEIAVFAIAEGESYIFCAFVRDAAGGLEMNDKIKSQADQRLVDQMAELERYNTQLSTYNKTISADLRKPLENMRDHALFLRGRIETSGDLECQQSIDVLCTQMEKLLRLLAPHDDTESMLRHPVIIRQSATNLSQVSRFE